MRIEYIGEQRDFSDRWLMAALSEQHEVRFHDLASWQDDELVDVGNNSLILNRLYASSWERYDSGLLHGVLKDIAQVEKRGVPAVNQARAWELENDRLRQYECFTQSGLDYVNTQPLESWKGDGPFLVKRNHSGRHQSLQVHKGGSGSSNEIGGLVAQPFIDSPTCYRLEVIGGSSLAYEEDINVDERGQLTFNKQLSSLVAPLDEAIVKQFVEAAGEWGVTVFSLEFFIIDGRPLVIDFNLTSNYPRILLQQHNRYLKDLWFNALDYAMDR